MKIYIDLLMILNFFFDFILLLSVSIILKRNANIYRIILGAFVGGISILSLFINFNSLTLFIFKFIISIFMVIISFNYKNIKYTIKNIIFLYLASIILGGFLYFLNIEFSYKKIGMVFINNGLSVNVIFLIIFCPIIIYIYVKECLSLKINYSNYYKINLYYNNKKYSLNGFVDTGNVLEYFNKPVILTNIKIDIGTFFYIPYKTIDNNGLIKCIKPDKIEINGKAKKALVGFIDKGIKIDGVDCLINKKILEG